MAVKRRITGTRTGTKKYPSATTNRRTTQRMMSSSKGSPTATLKRYSKGSAKFPTGASRFPSTASTKAEFTKMLGSATPAKRKSLQAQFRSINGTSWKGSATKFPSSSSSLRQQPVRTRKRTSGSTGVRDQVSSVAYKRGPNGKAVRVGGSPTKSTGTRLRQQPVRTRKRTTGVSKAGSTAVRARKLSDTPKRKTGTRKRSSTQAQLRQYTRTNRSPKRRTATRKK